MGVRGLTTFISNRSSQYIERYDLYDCYLVIDGNSIASQLYKWHCKSNDCFGGDYDKYGVTITTFFHLLSTCNITPLVVFDGAYEKRKLKTVFNRMRNKISACKDLNSVTEGRISVFPLFLRELFVDIIQNLQIQCVRCDFEGDSDAAILAKTLNCPLLSYDSDFYIFDVLYLPFSNMEMQVRRKNGVNYIACGVYRVDKFLQSFGGLQRVNLPLLAVILGNDYIKKKSFGAFFRQLKIQKSKGNEQQTLIKSVIVWLKDETPESALRKILGRFKMKHRKKLAEKIQNAIEGYQLGNTPICAYFNIEKTPEKDLITVPKAEEVEDLAEDECESSDNDDNNIDTNLSTPIPDFFTKNYRNCQYPSCFMDMIVSNTYFCIPQIDNYSTEHSHSISFEILAAIHKILTYPRTKPLICIARNQHLNIKKYKLPIPNQLLPQLIEIESMDLKKRANVLFQILQISNDFNNVPKSWHLFWISLKYWIQNSKVDSAFIYSIVLCALVLNFIDKKVGFYRSTKTFFNKFNTNLKVEESKAQTLTEALDDLDLNNSIVCMKKLINFFQMDVKMRSYVKLFDRNVIHQLAQFQSCLLHIKYLNSLLNLPFPVMIISDFYDGTFLYNMTVNLQKRNNLKDYIQLLLNECPKVLTIFELIIDNFEHENISHEPLKKRRKKKKPVKVETTPEINQNQSDDDYYEFDENNKYSLLSFINK